MSIQYSVIRIRRVLGWSLLIVALCSISYGQVNGAITNGGVPADNGKHLAGEANHAWTMLKVITCNADDWMGDSRIGSFSDDNSMLVTAVGNAGREGESGTVMLWSIPEARNVCRWQTYGKEVNGYYEGDYPTQVSFLPGSSSEFIMYTSCGRVAPKCAVQWGASKCGRKMTKADPVDIQYTLHDSGTQDGPRKMYSMLTDSLAIGYSSEPGSRGHDYGIYNMFTGQLVSSLIDSISNGYGPTMSRDGRYLLSTGAGIGRKTHVDSVMYVIDVSVSKVISEITLRSDHTTLCGADRILAVYDGKSRSTKIIDLATGKEVQDLVKYSGVPLVFSEDGVILATIAEQGLCLWSK
jgi:hypothetical protein